MIATRTSKHITENMEDDPVFYKKLPPEIAKKLKFLNKFLYPFIRMRFYMGVTNFLWEYAITSKHLKKIQKDIGKPEDNDMSLLGIRHHNTNYNFGY